ncbi:MFS transporter [Microbacterium sp. No. 7]|uniref:MFS transporter n=1 Tax=Microbacterium sp. No. 7 TaxID=1714373 RepID=UPI0006ECF5F7|nr:MFS transporter [Microbacterium sp. No. 7]ALJ18706.1 hypothetical protein AOA12_01775 [Microbacterium sp. No. 7]
MRERLFVPALVMVMVITALVAGFGTPLVPQMSRHFLVSMDQAQWVVTIPMLVGAVASPLIGRLGGPGRQRAVLLVCLALVTAGLALSALPLGFAAMLAGRALQGLGIALAPVVLALARGALGPVASLPLIANLSIAATVAAGLAFPVTSAVAGLSGISGAYWVGFVLSAITLLLVWYAIPADAAGTRIPIDWRGAGVLVLGSGALLVLISQVRVWSAVTSLAVAAASTLLIAYWVMRTLRVSNPLIDLRLAASPKVALAHVVMVLASMGTYLLLPLVMLAGQDESSLGVPLVFAGFLHIPYALGALVGARLGNRLRRRVSLSALLVIGLSGYALATLVLAFLHDVLGVVLLSVLLSGIGSGCTFAVAPQLIVQQVPQESASSALSFNMLLRYIGFSVGSALTPVLMGVSVMSGFDAYLIPFLAATAFFVVAIGFVLFSRRSGRGAEA